ncbi:MAG TPA: glycosyltransferase [Lachnospiraceae bacterium]|nr:glycosyltransferase [Lachnospiraceae bacterium]
MAHDDALYRQVLNSSALTFPDGAPVARLMRKRGFETERVAGPDFMEEVFKLTARDGRLSHFFYGSSEKTLALLKERLNSRFPGIRIAGMYSPPFRELTKEEDEAVTERIKSSGAELIWIGLGAPKQEKWMFKHKGAFCGVMLGVGAGFDFHAGTVKRAPLSWQRLGLEWLYRLISDPRRLFKRYLVTNTKFILYTAGMGRTGSKRKKK